MGFVVVRQTHTRHMLRRTAPSLGVGKGEGWLNWATPFYWRVMYPTFKAHNAAWQRVAVLDRFLEKRRMGTNFGIGGTFGLALYFILAPMMPNHVDRSLSSMRGDIDDVMALAKIDARNEMPMTAVSRIQYKTVSRVYEAKDAMDVKRQREAAASDAKEQAAEVAVLKAAQGAQ
jgi:hypothetical protein